MFPDSPILEYSDPTLAFTRSDIQIPNRLHAATIPGTFMMKWLTSCLLLRQRETKCRQKWPGVGWDRLKFSFHSLTTLLLLTVLSNQAYVLFFSAESPRFSIVPSSSPMKSVEEVNIVCVDNFGF